MNHQEVVDKRKMISYAGAFIALLIGSGFATGQELMQYFASYGYLGMLGIFLTFVLLAFLGVELIYAGYTQNFENPNDIYTYFVGNIGGKFFDIFAIFFLFLSYTVMVAGASATAVEHYQAPSWLGGTILAICVMGVVVLGLNRIVEVIGTIGPLIVLLTIIVGTISIFMNLDNFATAGDNLQKALDAGIMQVASSNFILSAVSYVGFCLIWLAAFISGIGKRVNSLKEGNNGMILGAFGFSLACLIMAIAIYLSIDKVHDSQIPILILARQIHPWLATIFSLIIFLGIFTTAVPLLWNVVARFAKEKTAKYRVLTVILGVIGAIIGLALDFSQLVNIVYVLNGYIGAILMLVIIYKGIRRRITHKE
ncbi:YkvI family membrane protein [Facklamia languida]